MVLELRNQLALLLCLYLEELLQQQNKTPAIQLYRQLLVLFSSTLEVAGTVDIGAPVAIDQTTPGTTNRVSVGTDVVAISASALPLPVGASTSAKQDTGNTSLASLDTKTPALSGGKVPVVGPTTPTDTQPVSAVFLASSSRCFDRSYSGVDQDKD